MQKVSVFTLLKTTGMLYLCFTQFYFVFLETKMGFLPHLWELNSHQSSATLVQVWPPTDLSFPWLCCVTSGAHQWCLWELWGEKCLRKKMSAKVFSKEIWGAGRTWNEKGWEGHSGGHLWHSDRTFLSSLGLGVFFTPLWKHNAVCRWMQVNVSSLKTK